MNKATRNGKYVKCFINGQGLDEPERAKLYLADKVEKHFFQLETELEDLEAALEKHGEKVLSAVDYVVFYSESLSEWIGCSIAIDRYEDGFFVSINYCQQIEEEYDPDEEDCPVIFIG